MTERILYDYPGVSVLETRKSYDQARNWANVSVSEAHDDGDTESHIRHIIDVYHQAIDWHISASQECLALGCVQLAETHQGTIWQLNRGREIEKVLLATIQLNNNAKSARVKK
jgi:hypothetical protein